MANYEVAEKQSRRPEQGDQASANIAASSWSASDMRALASKAENADISSLFGNLLLVAQSAQNENGYIGVYKPGARQVGEKPDVTREVTKIQEPQAAPEVAQRGSVISESGNQARWQRAQEVHKLGQNESATDLYHNPNYKKKPVEKFTLYDSAVSAGASKSGTFIDYPAVKKSEKSYALGMDHEQEDSRTGAQKVADFVQAAAKRTSDPEGQQTYIQGQLDKIAGVYEGMGIAKDQSKAQAVAGWKAMTDGTVATLLSKPNALNEPLMQAVGNVVDAMKHDPNAVNKAMERVGVVVMEASGHYSALPSKEKGHVIGEATFAMINPAGSTEGGALALKVADKVATHVDAAVMAGIQKSMQAAEEMAKTAPELAQQSKQMLFDYIKSKGLTGQELEYAGVPKGYFDGIKHSENINAMSKVDDLSAGKKPNDVNSGKSEKPPEVANEALDNPEGLAKLAKKFGINMPPKETYVFAGEKDAVSAEAAAKRLGITSEQLKNLDETTLAAQKLERVVDYRDAFFNRHPGLIPVADRITVHHAIPKWFLKRHPDLFSAKEINDVESLRGIYKLTNDELHNDLIHNAWERFNRGNSKPSRQDVLRMVEKIDRQYGHLFVPTEGK